MAKSKTIFEILETIKTQHAELVNDFKSQNKEFNEENDKEFFTKYHSILETNLPLDQNKAKKKICADLKVKAKEISDSVEYISEFNQFDLDSYHTDDNKKLNSLLKLGTDSNNWRIYNLSLDPEINCIDIMYGNTAVNSGNELFAHVLINAKGVIKHHFVVFNHAL